MWTPFLCWNWASTILEQSPCLSGENDTENAEPTWESLGPGEETVGSEKAFPVIRVKYKHPPIWIRFWRVPKPTAMLGEVTIASIASPDLLPAKMTSHSIHQPEKSQNIHNVLTLSVDPVGKARTRLESVRTTVPPCKRTLTFLKPGNGSDKNLCNLCAIIPICHHLLSIKFSFAIDHSIL